MRKVAVVANKELELSTGKLAAQVGHAAAMTGKKPRTPLIVLNAEDGEQLQQITDKAVAEPSVEAYKIRDAGRTEVDKNTHTVTAVYGKKSDVDEITGGLETV